MGSGNDVRATPVAVNGVLYVMTENRASCTPSRRSEAAGVRSAERGFRRAGAPSDR